MRFNAMIAGVGMTTFGKHMDRGLKSLGAEAVQAALADAGIEGKDLDAAYVGNASAGVVTGQESIRGQVILRSIGLGAGVAAALGLGAGMVAFPVTVVAGSYWLARSIFKAQVQRRQAQAHALVDRLAEQIEVAVGQHRVRLAGGPAAIAPTPPGADEPAAG